MKPEILKKIKFIAALLNNLYFWLTPALRCHLRELASFALSKEVFLCLYKKRAGGRNHLRCHMRKLL